MVIGKRTLPYLLVILVFILAHFVESGAGGCTLNRFLGPLPGFKYIYTGSDGSRIEMTGISTDKNNAVEIKEITFFPEDILPPDIPKSNSIQYRLSILGDKMIKENIKGREIVLQEPLSTESKPWKIRGKFSSRTNREEIQWKDNESKCKIVAKSKSNCFGKERCIITTECVASNSSCLIKRLETYAEGIGMIERILILKTKNGKKREIYRLTLNRIINLRCAGAKWPQLTGP